MSDQLGFFEVTEAKSPTSMSSEESPSPTGDSYEATGFEPDDEHPLRARSRLPPETCDCCGGKVKLYRRKLNSGMARTLCWLAVKDAKEPGCWVSAVDMPGKVEQYATELGKLDFWGLVSRRCNPDGSSYKESQQWCITTKGIQFARGKTEAPSHIFLQSPDNRIFGFEASTVGVRAALGKHFDYHDLMRGE